MVIATAQVAAINSGDQIPDSHDGGTPSLVGSFQNRVEPTEVVNAAIHYCRRQGAAVNCTSPEVQLTLRALPNESLGQLEKVIDKAIRAGELDPGADARALAVLISLVMQGMAQQARDGATRDEL